MRIQRCYSILLLLTLLAGPQVVQLWHELGEAHDSLCNETELHYCTAEHNCELCAVLRSNPATLPLLPSAPGIHLLFTDLYNFASPPALPATAQLHLFARGPPSC